MEKALRVRTILCAVVLSSGLALAAAADERLSVELGETISLKADRISLKEVLAELSEAVPFELVERGAALEELVSFEIEASTWEAAFAELLRQEGYALTTDGITGLPTTLVIDWDIVGEAHSRRVAPDDPIAPDDIEARIRAAAKDVLAPLDVAGEAIEAAVEAARLAVEAAQAEGSEAADALAEALETARAGYTEALTGLQGFDEERTVEALLSALEEEDREARLAALQSMRWLSLTGLNPEAVEAAAAAYDTAEDPEVERAALEVLVRYGDPDAVMSTLERLALAEGPNQDLAVREWIRMRDEQVAQERMRQDGDPQMLRTEK